MGRNPGFDWQPIHFGTEAQSESLSSRLMSNTVPELESDVARGIQSGVIEFPTDVSADLNRVFGRPVQAGLMVATSESVRILESVRARIQDWLWGLTGNTGAVADAAAPPYQINVHGTVGNIQIAQNSPGAMQTVEEGKLDLEDVSRFVERLAAVHNELGLADELGRELKSEIDTLKAQLISPAPKPGIIKAGLKRASEIVTSAMVSVAVENLIREFPKYLPFR